LSKIGIDERHSFERWWRAGAGEECACGAGLARCGFPAEKDGESHEFAEEVVIGVGSESG
jgi:hypothetical protein